MAKVSGPWLRGAKKKLAGVVLQKGGSGETIAREWVKPKNPQTQKQMAQRIIFATVAQAAKFMAPIVNHSFEGVEYGEKSLQRFKQLNLRRLRQLASWDYDHSPDPVDCKAFMTTRRISALIPNTYIVSDGSLANPRLEVEAFRNPNPEAYKFRIATPGEYSLPLVQDSEIEGYGVYIKDVLEKVLGLSKGDELTLLLIAGDGEIKFTYEDSLGKVIQYTDMQAFRVVVREEFDNQFVLISEDGQEVLEDGLDNLTDAFEACIDKNKSNEVFIEAVERFGFGLQDGNIVFSRSTEILNDVFGLEMIYSAGLIKSNGTQRNKCLLKNLTLTNISNYGLTWNVALDAWFRGEVVAESNRFLNEGGTINEIG